MPTVADLTCPYQRVGPKLCKHDQEIGITALQAHWPQTGDTVGSVVGSACHAIYRSVSDSRQHAKFPTLKELDDKFDHWPESAGSTVG
jgi:hypothetical protein